MNSELIDLTQKLIKFESTKNHPAILRDIVAFCADYFKHTGLIIHQYTKNDKSSLVVQTKQTKHPHIFMVGHLDVVEAEENQFEPVIKKKRLYGRGAADMKSADAIMMLALKNIFEVSQNKSVGLILTTDEEVGGFDGVKHLVNDLGYRTNVAFVPDGGYNFKIITTQKGIIHFKLSANGKSVHGSRPWLGKNAIKSIMQFYVDLEKEFPMPKGKHTWKPTINLGKIEGGEAINKVPDKCSAWFDFRYTEDKAKHEWLEILKDKAHKHQTKFELITEGDICHTDKHNQYIKYYKKISEDILRRKAVFSHEHGGSDARFFSSHNIPVIISTAVGGNVHGKDEWIDLKSLEKFYQIVYKFIQGVG